MSDLQNKAKPILLPMITGSRKQLRTEEARALANWMTMFVMVYEWMDPDTVSIDFKERHKFKEHRRPHKNWAMWAIPFRGDSLTFYHRALQVDEHTLLDKSISVDIPVDKTKIEFSSQLTVIGIGRLCIAAYSATRRDYFTHLHNSASSAIYDTGFAPFWPTLDEHTVPLIGVPPFTQVDIARFMDLFFGI
jgi:hypothetical protein